MRVHHPHKKYRISSTLASATRCSTHVCLLLLCHLLNFPGWRSRLQNQNQIAQLPQESSQITQPLPESNRLRLQWLPKQCMLQTSSSFKKKKKVKLHSRLPTALRPAQPFGQRSRLPEQSQPFCVQLQPTTLLKQSMHLRLPLALRPAQPSWTAQPPLCPPPWNAWMPPSPAGMCVLEVSEAHGWKMFFIHESSTAPSLPTCLARLDASFSCMHAHTFVL